MILLFTSLKGRANSQNMLTEAPQRFLITMRAWLAKERNRYVGNNSGKDGTFRKQIMRLKRSEGASDSFRRGGKWPEKLARSFKGYIYNKTNLNDLTLKMGAGLRDASKFMQGMAMMDATKGGGTISSSKFMALPVYKNLQKLGIEKGLSKAFGDFPQGQLVPLMAKSGTLLWFDKAQMYKRQRGGNPFKKSALMFIGKKQVKIKQHFDFSKQFYSGADAIRRRGMTALNWAVRDLNEGYVGTGANISAKGSSGRTVVVNE
jgi:hypothetical protein